MSRFRICLDRLLKHEGGFVNHPEDPGGATNMGITQSTLAQWMKRPVTVFEVKALSRETAADIYRARYWDPVKADQLPPGVDYMVFDMAVNSGPARAIRFLQLAVGVNPDSEIGPVTLAAVKAKPAEAIVRSFAKRREAFFVAQPTFGTFGKGWLRRLAEVSAAATDDARA